MNTTMETSIPLTEQGVIIGAIGSSGGTDSLSILLDRFPSARAIATPKTVNAMQMSFTPPVERLARRLFPGQLATRFIAPQPYEHDTFTLEGQESRPLEPTALARSPATQPEGDLISTRSLVSCAS
jgi:hypothetical protein